MSLSPSLRTPITTLKTFSRILSVLRQRKVGDHVCCKKTALSLVFATNFASSESCQTSHLRRPVCILLFISRF